MYICYLLTCNRQRRTYIGMTNNFTRRIRQHNGELAGGARATSNPYNRPWTLAATVHNFRDKIHAMQFEWRWKKSRPRAYGVKQRIKKLDVLIDTFNKTCDVKIEKKIHIHFNYIESEVNVDNNNNHSHEMKEVAEGEGRDNNIVEVDEKKNNIG